MSRRVPAGLAAAFMLIAPVAACDADDADCSGAGIRPHLSPVSFGDLWALGKNETPNPATGESVPFEWVLLLQSTCGAPLDIARVCVVGDAHNGVEGDGAFVLEGPVPASVPPGSEAAVRLTYDHPDVNSLDDDADGEPDPDRVAVVVRSNATDFPTLVVPVCARIVPRGDERLTFSCTSPVTTAEAEAACPLP